MHRRHFLTLAGASLLTAGCQRAGDAPKPAPSPSASSVAVASPAADMARYPEKLDLILQNDRPPLLETPLQYFKTDLTPNDAFYVRWHLANVPLEVDLATWRLEVGGSVKTPLKLSLDQLKKEFEAVSLVAVNQCSGNARGLFEPPVPGGQWKNGAMGNARWTGVRLKDVLAKAGIAAGAVDVTFQGLDTPPLPTVPDFVKSLEVKHAMDGEVMIAYAMNDAPLPMLNGFPVRLVVPGWYATYWVKSLTHVNVLNKPFEGYWMKVAYRIPANADANESPTAQSAKTVPISRMSLRSVFVVPEPSAKVPAGKPVEVQGVAFDGGSGIASVEFSANGTDWTPATLGPDLGKYGWRRWTAAWTPTAPGKATLRVRARSNSGEQQRTAQWNHGGYQRNIVESVEVDVV